ncbi:hypothetical protein LBMAG52_36010 [Planctomycetia bacterium]|nr:hypothetical protein LBMAG52_36010 [Planctomycetia bacterium]
MDTFNGEKPGGWIVDLIGLADPLADALAMYANATGESDKPIKELQDEAIPAMRSAFEQLRGFFHGYDYSAALDQWHSVCDFVSGKALAAGRVVKKNERLAPCRSAKAWKNRRLAPCRSGKETLNRSMCCGCIWARSIMCWTSGRAWEKRRAGSGSAGW